MLALTIIVALQSVGIVLVAALLVTPAAAAYQLTSRFAPMMIACRGLRRRSARSAGSTSRTILRSSSGATIVLLATVLFFLSLGVKYVRQSAARSTRHVSLPEAAK